MFHRHVLSTGKTLLFSLFDRQHVKVKSMIQMPFGQGGGYQFGWHLDAVQPRVAIQLTEV